GEMAMRALPAPTSTPENRKGEQAMAADQPPRDVRQRVDTDEGGLVLRVERELLPPRLRDVPAPASPALRVVPRDPPMAARLVDTQKPPVPLPTLSWEWVTPAIAANWLSYNTGNRPLKESRVAYYARLMEDGVWRDDSPEPFMFDWNHDLRNGQHRLAAVGRSKRTVAFLVARGIDPALGDVIDPPAVRTAGDRLALGGGGTSGRGARYAAAIRGLEAWKDAPLRGPFERQPTARSNAELVALLGDFRPLLDHYLPLSSGMTHAQPPIRGGDSLWLTLLCRFDGIDPQAAWYFGDHVASGEDLSAGNPILVLKRLLSKGSEELPARPGSGIGRLATARHVVNAWNAWREGRKITRLRDDKGDFPLIEGHEKYPAEAARRRRDWRSDREGGLTTFPGSRGASPNALGDAPEWLQIDAEPAADAG